MKKLISLLLCAAMAFSLVTVAAADSDQELLGKYYMEFDLTELAVTYFDEGTGAGDTISLGDYLSKMAFSVNFEFNDDGTYQIYADEESIQDAMDEFRDAAIVFMDDFIFIMLVQMLAEEGVEVRTREEIEELIGMSFEDMYSEFLGMSVEDFVDEQMVQSFDLGSLAEGFETEGQYKAADGRLRTSTSLDEKPSLVTYEEYVIEDGIVTITGIVNAPEGTDTSVYPLVLIPVEEAA